MFFQVDGKYFIFHAPTHFLRCIPQLYNFFLLPYHRDSQSSCRENFPGVPQNPKYFQNYEQTKPSSASGRFATIFFKTLDRRLQTKKWLGTDQKILQFFRQRYLVFLKNFLVKWPDTEDGFGANFWGFYKSSKKLKRWKLRMLHINI